MPERIWYDHVIKAGIEKFKVNHGRIPTAADFDDVAYLPSARHIQRALGGLVELRERLGYHDLDFTRGKLRTTIVTKANKGALEAEDNLEPILIKHFGEPYVHVQKRFYQGTKNRYDFFIYAESCIFAVDIFTTSRAEYIGKNVRLKLTKYENIHSDLIIYFVVGGYDYDAQDIAKSIKGIRPLTEHKNIRIMCENDFLSEVTALKPLTMPQMFAGVEQLTAARHNQIRELHSRHTPISEPKFGKRRIV